MTKWSRSSRPNDDDDDDDDISETMAGSPVAVGRRSLGGSECGD